MHRRAGVKMHHARPPEGPRGGLLAGGCDDGGLVGCGGMGSEGASSGGGVSPCQSRVAGRWPGVRSNRDRRLPVARRLWRRLEGCPASLPAKRYTVPAILSVSSATASCQRRARLWWVGLVRVSVGARVPTTGVPAARVARWRAWRSASVMALSPIDLRGMVPLRSVTSRNR